MVFGFFITGFTIADFVISQSQTTQISLETLRLNKLPLSFYKSSNINIDHFVCEGQNMTNFHCENSYAAYGCFESCKCCYFEEKKSNDEAVYQSKGKLFKTNTF